MTDPNPRDLWHAWYRLYRLSSRQGKGAVHDALCVLCQDNFWRFFACICQNSDPLEYSWAEFPLMRKLRRPRVGPAMERIYPWDEQGELL